MRGKLSGGPRGRIVLGVLLLAVIAAVVRAQDTVYISDDYPSQGIDCCDPIVSDVSLTGWAGQDRLWFDVDYLYWQLSGTDLPPLVTASPAGTALTDAGVLGDPTTEILAGNSEVNNGWRSGYRLQGGFWLDGCRTLALTAEYFDAGSDDYRFTQGSDPDLIVTRPIFNTELGEWDVEFVSIDGELDGGVSVLSSDDFRGAAIGLQRCLRRCCNPCGCGPSWNLDLIGNYRYYQYNSRLVITEDLTVLDGTSTPLVPGTTIDLRDSFSARNEFHGGEIGLKGRVTQSYLWLEGLASVAVGAHHRSVTIDGSTVNTVPSAGSSTMAGGLLTSEVTNIGHYSDTRTAVIPNLRLALGCQLTNHVSGHFGYNVIVWDDVVRAADHLPPGLEVDPRNLPPVQAGGGPEPEFPGLRGSTMVAHGFDLGLEFTY